MEEMKKIHRTAAKKIPGAPHEVLLILDATTGQNALNQARLFHEAVGVTGLILTKMDGTAKGGVAPGGGPRDRHPPEIHRGGGRPWRTCAPLTPRPLWRRSWDKRDQGLSAAGV